MAEDCPGGAAPGAGTAARAPAAPGLVARRMAVALAVGIALLPGAVMPAAAQPPADAAAPLPADPEAALAALAAAAADPARSGLPAGEMIAAAGLATWTGAAERAAPPAARSAALFPYAPSAEGPAPVAARMDVRLALTLLSVAHGDEENWRVLAAQTGPAPGALVLAAGRAGAADLPALLAAQGLPPPGPAGELRVALVILPGAALAIGPGEALRLSRPDGAFVLNLGDLRIAGGTVAAIGPAHPVSRSFVPFLATAQAGTLTLERATVLGLGFGGTAKFAGVAVLRDLLHRPARPAAIVGSRLAGLHGVVVQGEAGAVIAGNRFEAPGRVGLTLAQAAGARVAGNLFAGPMRTNAVLAEGSPGLRIEGNVVLGGARAGIAVRAGSDGAVVAGNVVWRRDGGGIAVAASDCVALRANLVLGNRQKGIELRAAAAAMVEGNAILGSGSAGLWLADHPGGAATRVSGNRFAANREGVGGARPGAVDWLGNDLDGQLLRLASGDLAAETARLASDLRGARPLRLGGASAAAAAGGEAGCAG